MPLVHTPLPATIPPYDALKTAMESALLATSAPPRGGDEGKDKAPPSWFRLDTRASVWARLRPVMG